MGIINLLILKVRAAVFGCINPVRGCVRQPNLKGPDHKGVGTGQNPLALQSVAESNACSTPQIKTMHASVQNLEVGVPFPHRRV